MDHVYAKLYSVGLTIIVCIIVLNFMYHSAKLSWSCHVDMSHKFQSEDTCNNYIPMQKGYRIVKFSAHTHTYILYNIYIDEYMDIGSANKLVNCFHFQVMPLMLI